MARCDLCGAHCRSEQLTTLLATYQVAGVEDICPDCEKWASGVKADLLGAIAPVMREEITKRRQALQPGAKTPVGFWRRFFGWIVE